MSRPPVDERIRFWSHVDKTTTPDGCWTWTASQGQWGYGAFKWQGRVGKAHRAGYEFQVGPIPEGLHVCHHCDNRLCVRGNRLFVGTAADNKQDAKNKGRIGISAATREMIVALREEGLLYREIGLRVGLSRVYVGWILTGRPRPPGLRRRARPPAPTEDRE